jgi:iron complex transport system substrate-binding protein
MTFLLETPMKSRNLAALLIGASLVVAAPVLAQDFPVTLTHEYGETVIPAKPERIATIGWMSQDAVLALGQVPVGIPLQAWGGDENGMLPWVATAVAELGGELPVRYDDTAIPFEEILALEPDLILAPYSALTPEEYNRLSQIAPTVAWTGAVWSGTWQDITLTVGRALGEEAKAQELVEATDARLAAIAAEHPEFSGKTFTIGWGDPASSELGVYVGTDPRVQMIEDIGLKLSDGAAAFGSENFYVPVAYENLDTLDADVLITWQSDQAELDAVLANPVFARFGPVASGHHLVMLDRAFVMATSAPSVLSIPWSMEKLVPELSALFAD